MSAARLSYSLSVACYDLTEIADDLHSATHRQRLYGPGVAILRRQLAEITEQIARIRDAFAGLSGDDAVEDAEIAAAGYEELAAVTRLCPPLARLANGCLIANVTDPEQWRQITDVFDGADATLAGDDYVQYARSFGGLEVLVQAIHEVHEAAQDLGMGEAGAESAPGADALTARERPAGHVGPPIVDAPAPSLPVGERS